MLDTYSGVALQLISTVVLARLLSPEEVGVFAIAAVFTAIAGSIRHFGVHEYVTQESELTPQLLRAAFGVSLVASVSLGVLLNLLAPLVASFYRNEKIATVLHVVSLTFFMTPFAAVTLAYFRRELQMWPTFLTSLASNVVSFVVAIGMAMEGFGPMSLAWSAVAGAATTVAVALWFRPSTIPMRPSLRGARRVFAFGKHVSGIYAFGQLGASAPDVIIGKADGVASVAFFSRAYGLIELFNKLVLYSIWPVVVPVFAKRSREAGGVQTTYLIGTSYLTVIAWPILFLMGLLAFPAIRIFYGPQWLASVPLTQILCIAAAISVCYHLTKDTLLAIGMARECNYLQIKVHLLKVCGILMVVPYGLKGACWGIVCASLVSLVLTHRALHRATGLTARDVVSSVGSSLRVATFSVVPAWLLLAALPPDETNFIWIGLIATLMTGVTWVWLLRVSNHVFWGEVAQVAHRVGWRWPVSR